jgi:hypothetical protein
LWGTKLILGTNLITQKLHKGDRLASPTAVSAKFKEKTM